MWVVSLTGNDTRPVGHRVPTAGEALPWTSALQPRCPAGELGYCMHLFFCCYVSDRKTKYDWVKSVRDSVRKSVSASILHTPVLHMCSQRASGERGMLRAVCPLIQTASVRNTSRLWARSAGHTSGKSSQHLHKCIRCNQGTLVCLMDLFFFAEADRSMRKEFINSLFILWTTIILLSQGKVGDISRLSTLFISLSLMLTRI